MQRRIKNLIKNGVFDQNAIFNLLYPEFNGHYSRLRDMISTEKNGMYATRSD